MQLNFYIQFFTDYTLFDDISYIWSIVSLLLIFCTEKIYTKSKNSETSSDDLSLFAALSGLYLLWDSFDDFSVYFFIFIFIISDFCIHIYWTNNSTSTDIKIDTTIILNFIFFFSAPLLSVNDDYVYFLINLEGLSLSLYLLATVGRNFGGIIAAVKYFTFGTLGSVFLYWGAVTIFELLGSSDLDELNYLFLHLNSSACALSSYYYFKLLYIGSFITIGLLLKLGAAPTHQWIVDVYSGVMIFILFYYAILIKFILFNIYFNITDIINTNSEVEYAACCSILVGSIGTLQQTKLKRFLAYSSITHTGFLLMGDYNASNIYLLTYVLSSILFFSVILSENNRGKEFIYLTDLRYLNPTNQASRLYIVVSLLSMAGIPPFAGFYGKFSIWLSLVEDMIIFNDHWSFIMFIVSLLSSMIVIYYYVKIISIIYSTNDKLSINTSSISSNQVTTLLLNNSATFSLLKNSITSAKNKLQLFLLFIIINFSFIVPIINNFYL